MEIALLGEGLVVGANEGRGGFDQFLDVQLICQDKDGTHVCKREFGSDDLDGHILETFDTIAMGCLQEINDKILVLFNLLHVDTKGIDVPDELHKDRSSKALDDCFSYRGRLGGFSSSRGRS